jgi:hypothetical protein
MLPLPKFLTLPAILKTLFPPASPGKASEFPEKWVINGFYAIVGWSLLGAPNWSNASAPTITLPKLPETKTPVVTPVVAPVVAPVTPVVTPVMPQTSTFTTAKTTTAVKPLSTVLVRCPGNIQVVNIRQGAGLTPILATVPCGDRVNLLGTNRLANGTETWVPIEYKGTKGWATARYLAL